MLPFRLILVPMVPPMGLPSHGAQETLAEEMTRM